MKHNITNTRLKVCLPEQHEPHRNLNRPEGREESGGDGERQCKRPKHSAALQRGRCRFPGLVLVPTVLVNVPPTKEHPCSWSSE